MKVNIPWPWVVWEMDFRNLTQVELESPRCSSQMHSMLGSAMCCVCHRLPRVGSFGAVWGFYSKNIRTRWAPTSYNYNSTYRGEITPVPSFIRPFMGVIIPCITSRDRRNGRFMMIYVYFRVDFSWVNFHTKKKFLPFWKFWRMDKNHWFFRFFLCHDLFGSFKKDWQRSTKRNVQSVSLKEVRRGNTQNVSKRAMCLNMWCLL